jgi:predicted TPR repeat methyltransferase
MSIESAYNNWAPSYDSMPNKTRDLEAKGIREILSKISFTTVLELGCGTGKNTEWLLNKADKVLSVDFSEDMLQKAKEKKLGKKVHFIAADINQDWHFSENNQYDLIVFSLVLEHIQNLEPIFEKANKCMAVGGYIYIGELHPFKQYAGSKARFETENGTQVLECYTHHVSDYWQSVAKFGFKIVELNEYFDQNQTNEIPRILSILFQKIV